jgi:excisionase family DNA binding protein
VSDEHASARAQRRERALAAIQPRLLDVDQAAAYLSISTDTLTRLVHTGAIGVVRIPVERNRRTGRGLVGMSRRILIDRHELDELIPKWRERDDL